MLECKGRIVWCPIAGSRIVWIVERSAEAPCDIKAARCRLLRSRQGGLRPARSALRGFLLGFRLRNYGPRSRGPGRQVGCPKTQAARKSPPPVKRQVVRPGIAVANSSQPPHNHVKLLRRRAIPNRCYPRRLRFWRHCATHAGYETDHVPHRLSGR